MLKARRLCNLQRAIKKGILLHAFALLFVQTPFSMSDNRTLPPVWQALIPIIFLVLLLVLNVRWFDDALSGPNQLALLLAATVGGLLAVRNGTAWDELLEGMLKSIGSAMSSVLILLLIGALAGTWLLSGIVPAMIYYGLELLHPSIFLVAACIVSALIAVATGSSWSTIATIGLALLGIGKALGMHEGLVAGAIISGAYFGDKMSPLSDTTNLAPAMAGTDLFTHIRYMTFTTVPSMAITLIIFLVIGFTQNSSGELTDITPVLQALEAKFNISVFLFLVPALVVFIIVKRTPALPALLAGTILGGIAAVIFQPDLIKELAGSTESYGQASYVAVLKAMYGSISFQTGQAAVDDLLGTGGMAGMLNTIWLVFCAMVFGGIMESSGMLKATTTAILQRFVRSEGSLVASTAGTCILFNVTTADQYLAIVVPGKMFSEAYADYDLAPENLSRTLEDSGTVTSVLIPWNTCGATQAGVLKVATVDYFFYCFFNWISPLMTILFAVLRIKLRRRKEAQD